MVCFLPFLNFIEFILGVVSESIDIILDKYTRKHIENYIFMELVDKGVNITNDKKKIIKYIYLEKNGIEDEQKD